VGGQRKETRHGESCCGPISFNLHSSFQKAKLQPSQNRIRMPFMGDVRIQSRFLSVRISDDLRLNKVSCRDRVVWFEW